MSLRTALSSMGLLEPARRVRAAASRLGRVLSAAGTRTRRRDRRQFRNFAARHGAALSPARVPAGPARRALIVGRIGRTAESQIMAARVLQAAGYTPTILLLRPEDAFLRPYCDLAGIAVEDWPASPSARCVEQAGAMLARCRTLQDVLDLDDHGVRVGRSALSSTLRASQVGLLELDLDGHDARLISGLSTALAAADTARGIVTRLAPDLTFSYEMEYTPKRELFDASLARGGAVITTCRAPRRDTVLLKRYTSTSNHQHPTSLSDAAWARLQAMDWTPARRDALATEVRRCYESGDWWGIPTARGGRDAPPPEDIRRRLGLAPGRKVAFVFPHVPWDASFCWGVDLFGDYQTWLLETLRAACENPHVTWVIKIHPANLGKSMRMGAGGDPIELAAIRQQLGALPGHVVLLPPDTEFSTISLFGIMDYCLTVRGTVGLEAASRGIPVLTGGTGRYDQRGFTVDSTSAAQYLDRVRRIQEIPPMTGMARELAERFAYGMFVLRPLALEPALIRSLEAATGSVDEAIGRDPDVSAFTAWLHDAASEDFLCQ